MAGNIGQAVSSSQIAVKCNCGGQFFARAEHIGKTLKCPKCGGPIVVHAPPSASYSEVAAPATGMSKTLLFSLVFIVLAVVGGTTAFVINHFRVQHEARADEAKKSAKAAVVASQAWIEKNTTAKADQIEKELNVALNDENLVEKRDVQQALDLVRQHKTNLSANARLRQNKDAAAAMLAVAKKHFEAKRVPEAIGLLKQYVASPYASEVDPAQKLLAELEASTSETAAMDALIAMKPTDFEQFSLGAISDRGEFSTPELRLIWNDTLKRMLPAASAKRKESEAVRLAEENRQKAARIAEQKRLEAERLAMAEQKIQEDKQKEAAAKLQEELSRPVIVSSLETMLSIHEFPAKYVGRTIHLVSKSDSTIAWLDPSEMRRSGDVFLMSWSFGENLNTSENLGNQFGIVPDTLNYGLSPELAIRIKSDWPTTGLTNYKVFLEFQISQVQESGRVYYFAILKSARRP